MRKKIAECHEIEYGRFYQNIKLVFGVRSDFEKPSFVAYSEEL